MQRSWLTARVFISSTFRDMHAERDHLIKVVFPKLREWCARRQIHLVDIDLRWGVTQEQAENNKVLEICLEEVDGSRPFFVCMLGSRYGYVPNPMPPGESYLTRAAAPGSPARSVTHLEIEHALDPFPRRDERSFDRAAHTFFYLRDLAATPPPAALTSLTDDQRAVYAVTFFEQTEQTVSALAALKDDIRERAPDRVRSYAPVWDASAVNYEDPALIGRLRQLEDFGRQVYDDLIDAIGSEFAAHIEPGFDEYGEPKRDEDWEHDAFAQARTTAFVARPAVADALTRLVDEADRRPLAVVGEPGSGKTTLIAAWREARAQHAQDAIDAGAANAEIVVGRSVGASVTSTLLAQLLRGICQQVAQACGVAWPEYEALAPDPVALAQSWTGLIAAMADGRPVVIVIDGIDRLENGDAARWIPRDLPSSVSLVVSFALRSGQTLADMRLSHARELRVPALTPDERAELVRRLPGLFCKTLESHQVQRILANPASQNPLFLAVALEELRVAGAREVIDAEIAALPTGAAGGDIGAAVDEMFARVIRRLERDDERNQPGLAEAVFAALAVARHGLSDAELEAIAAHALALPQHAVAEPLQIVLRQLRAYMMRKGAGAVSLTDFFHDSFRHAVRARYLPTDQRRKAAHARLAGYFAALPDEIADAEGAPQPNARKAAELPFQYLNAGDRVALQAVLIDIRFVETKCRSGLAADLQNDYALALGDDGDNAALSQYARALADCATEARQQGAAHKPRMARFLSAFASKPEPRVAVPSPPSSEPARLAVAPQQPEDPPPLESFARFVSAHQHLLAVHAEHTIALARNAASNGAAAHAADAAAHGLLRDPRPSTGRRPLLLRKLVGHLDKVTALAVAANGSVAASASEDSTVRLWDPATGAELARLAGHSGGVFSVAISADGQVAISGGEDLILRVWDIASGALRDELHGHLGAIRAVALSPDGAVAASVGEDDAVLVWDLAGKTALRQIPLEPYTDEPFEGAPISGLARSQAGNLLYYSLALSATGGLLTVSLLNFLYRMRNEEPRATLRLIVLDDQNIPAVESPQTHVVALLPDGSMLLHGTPPRSEEEEAAIVRIKPDKTVERTNGRVPPNLWAAAASHDGNFIAGLRRVVGAHDIRTLRTTLYAIDLENGSGRMHDVSRHHPVGARCLAMTPDGGLALTGDDAGTICVWNLAGRADALPPGHDGRVYGIAMTDDGTAVSSGADHAIRLWSADGGSQDDLDLGDNYLAGVATSADGNAVWNFNAGKFYRLDVAAAQFVTSSFPSDDQSLCLPSVARRIPCVVGAGSVDHRLYYRDLERDDRWFFFEDALSPLIARPVASDDGRVFFTAHENNRLLRWDAAEASCRDLTDIFPFTAALGLTAGGRHLYTLGLFGDVRLYDPDTGEMIGRTSLPADLLRVHCDNVMMNVRYPEKALELFPDFLCPNTWTFAISDDGSSALVVAADDTVRWWNLLDETEIGLYAAEQEITAFTASGDLSRCCVGTADGQLHFLRAQPGQRPIRLAQVRLGAVRSRRSRAAARLKQRNDADIAALKRELTAANNPDASVLDIIQHTSDMPDAEFEMTLAELAEFRETARARAREEREAAAMRSFGSSMSESAGSDDALAEEALDTFVDWLFRYNHRRAYASLAAAAEFWVQYGGGKDLLAKRYDVFAIFSRKLVDQYADGISVRLDEAEMALVPGGGPVPLLDEATFLSACKGMQR